MQRPVVDLVGRPERGDQPARELRDGLHRADAALQDSKLVTAQPAEAIARLDDGLQAGTDLAQHLVARAMTMGVVDVLEVIQIEAEDRECRTSRAPAPGRLAQRFAEAGAIEQPRKRVMAREVAHPLADDPVAVQPPPPPDRKGREQCEDDRGNRAECGADARLPLGLVDVDLDDADHLPIALQRNVGLAVASRARRMCPLACNSM